MQLTFYVKKRDEWLPDTGKLSVYLKKDNWNDFSYRTLYEVIIFDENSNKIDLGYVKIANFGQTIEERVELPRQFNGLDERFFSLGQSREYYENIQNLHPILKEQYLTGLRDIVFDEDLQERALEEDVTNTSLLRDTSWTSVKGQYKRILDGGVVLTKFNFEYKTVQLETEAGYKLSFNVNPESNPPTNIHVLIGRNGVGKTHLLNNMIKTLLVKNDSQGSFQFIEDEWEDESQSFSSVVSVSFSAFDPFKPYVNNNRELKYKYIGLKQNTDEEIKLKSYDELAEEFFESIKHSFHIGRADRWIKAINSLNSDPLFENMNIEEFIKENYNNEEKIKKIFKRLSSGHGIVLLTLTKLVETIEEKTLVFLDEPEGHLHPPLLSAFVRALSDLLLDRNAVAIIATHSPVIAQEVPKSCVWKLSRFGLEAKAERPEIETFGENIGTLTREIFGLEVSKSGFHKLLSDDIESGKTYDEILDKYDNQLSFEARLLLRALLVDNYEDLI